MCSKQLLQNSFGTRVRRRPGVSVLAHSGNAVFRPAQTNPTKEESGAELNLRLSEAGVKTPEGHNLSTTFKKKIVSFLIANVTLYH